MKIKKPPKNKAASKYSLQQRYYVYCFKNARREWGEWQIEFVCRVICHICGRARG